MSQQSVDLLEKVRQQFDTAPYPRVPLDTKPQNYPHEVYIHNLVTAFYIRDRQITDTKDKLILDAGCGTGYNAQILAYANPGARVVGIDLSDESIKLARERLKYHSYDNAEFHTMTLEELPSLGLQFDYINCDEVLYLLPDPVVGLQAMKAVLKPDGIIRTNFHSSLQRFVYHRGQEMFTQLGLMEGAPDDEQLSVVREVMRSLNEWVFMRTAAWKPEFETNDELLLANYLLRGDKGWTIPEFFTALQKSDLQFISMVNWWQWDLTKLFRDFDELPVTLLMRLADMSVEEQLHLFELAHPMHRLLDIWCGHTNSVSSSPTPPNEWTDTDWHKATVYLHPQVNTSELKENLLDCITQFKTFEISQQLKLTDKPVTIDSSKSACLVPLFEAPQPMAALVDRLMQVRPVHPITLEPTDRQDAFALIKQLLIQLEEFGYILVETK